MNNPQSKRHLPVAAFAGLVLVTSQAQAGVDLSIEPSADAVHAGEILMVDITASGLDDDDLAGFNLVLNFDPNVLEFQSYTLGAELTDPVFGQEDLSDTGGVATGTLGLGEVSWLIDFSAQPDAFVLASASFAPLASGTSLLTLSDVELSDDLGGILQLGTLGDARVSVPVPGNLLLLPIGLGLFGLQRMRRR